MFYEKNHVFDVLYTLLNATKCHPENALNRISETLNFKIFPGGMAPDPPSWSNTEGVLARYIFVWFANRALWM